MKRIRKYADIKTKNDVITFIHAYIWYRGGMGNRIDAFDIRDFLAGFRKRELIGIMSVWNKLLDKRILKTQTAQKGKEER